MLGFHFTQLWIVTAWALHYLRLCNSPTNKRKKTIGVSRKQSGWNNNTVIKVNLANDAIEHWDNYFSYVKSLVAFTIWQRKNSKIVSVLLAPLPLLMHQSSPRPKIFHQISFAIKFPYIYIGQIKTLYTYKKL